MKNSVRDIEERWGLGIPELIRDFAGQGLTAKDTAKALGIGYSSLLLLAKKLGFKWPRLPSKKKLLGGAEVSNCGTKFVATIDGIELSVSEHCKRLGVSYSAVYALIRKGETPEQAVKSKLGHVPKERKSAERNVVFPEYDHKSEQKRVAEQRHKKRMVQMRM